MQTSKVEKIFLQMQLFGMSDCIRGEGTFKRDVSHPIARVKKSDNGFAGGVLLRCAEGTIRRGAGWRKRQLFFKKGGVRRHTGRTADDQDCCGRAAVRFKKGKASLDAEC